MVYGVHQMNYQVLNQVTTASSGQAGIETFVAVYCKMVYKPSQVRAV